MVKFETIGAWNLVNGKSKKDTETKRKSILTSSHC